MEGELYEREYQRKKQEKSSIGNEGHVDITTLLDTIS